MSRRRALNGKGSAVDRGRLVLRMVVSCLGTKSRQMMANVSHNHHRFGGHWDPEKPLIVGITGMMAFVMRML